MASRLTDEEAKLRDEALAEGYADETCSTCGVEFLAHIHFVRCDAASCPMKSTSNPEPILDRLLVALSHKEGGS